MKQEQLQLTGFSKKESRRELDFYPTPKECTIALMEFLQLPPTMEIREPACGSGDISEVLKSYGHYVHSSDIRTDCGYGIGGIDYLQYQPVYDKSSAKIAAIITNPPFNLSAKFIVKALSETKIVAMLLKSQYWHSKGRYDLYTSNPPAYVLPLTWRPNFAPDKGTSPTMEVAWTVWIEGNTGCKYVPLPKPKI